MAKSVVLHIGTPKTGTTSIQHSLARAQRNGGLGKVHYPLWENDNNQQRLAVLYFRPDELDALLPSLRERYPSAEWDFRHMRERYRDMLFGELRSAEKVIISAEMLSYLFTPKRAAQLRDVLEKKGFRQFHIVLYVRDPAGYYLSSTHQSLRMSDELPLIKDPATFKYDFLRVAEVWEEVFPGRLIVRKYDPNLDVLDDFRNVMQQCLGVALPRVPLRRNSTFSTEGMQILQDYREMFWSDNGGYMTPDTSRLVAFLEQSSLAQDLHQTRPALKAPVAEQIRANHRADAEVLRSRYGVDLGLRNCGRVTVAPRIKPYRVDEIVQSVDPAVVHQLLLRFVRVGLVGPVAKRALPLRVAARVYRSVPTALRPAGLDAALKRRFLGSE